MIRPYDIAIRLSHVKYFRTATSLHCYIIYSIWFRYGSLRGGLDDYGKCHVIFRLGLCLKMVFVISKLQTFIES